VHLYGVLLSHRCSCSFTLVVATVWQLLQVAQRGRVCALLLAERCRVTCAGNSHTVLFHEFRICGREGDIQNPSRAVSYERWNNEVNLKLVFSVRMSHRSSFRVGFLISFCPDICPCEKLYFLFIFLTFPFPLYLSIFLPYSIFHYFSFFVYK